jgi:hypothetical protein
MCGVMCLHSVRKKLYELCVVYTEKFKVPMYAER